MPEHDIDTKARKLSSFEAGGKFLSRIPGLFLSDREDRRSIRIYPFDNF